MESHDPVLEGGLREAFATAAEPVQGLGVRLEAIRTAVARRHRNRRMVRYAVAASLAGAAAIATAVLVPRGDDDALRTVDGRPATSAPSTTAFPSTTTTQEEVTTSTTGVAGSATTSLTATSSTASTTSSTTSTTAGQLPAFPPEHPGVAQGDQVWGLYMVIVPMEQPDEGEIAAANTALGEAGYRGSSGGTGGATQLACDLGAPEAFGREGTPSVTVAVYFVSQAHAEQARAAFRARDVPSLGIAQVTMNCIH